MVVPPFSTWSFLFRNAVYVIAHRRSFILLLIMTGIMIDHYLDQQLTHNYYVATRRDNDTTIH